MGYQPRATAYLVRITSCRPPRTGSWPLGPAGASVCPEWVPGERPRSWWEPRAVRSTRKTEADETGVKHRHSIYYLARTRDGGRRKEEYTRWVRRRDKSFYGRIRFRRAYADLDCTWVTHYIPLLHCILNPLMPSHQGKVNVVSPCKMFYLYQSSDLAPAFRFLVFP